MSDRIEYKVAVCGIGRIAYSLEKDDLRPKPCTHIGAIEKNGFLKLSEVCDISSFRLKQIYTDSIIKDICLYNDYRKMALESDSDVLVISSTSYTHMDILNFCLENMRNLRSIVCEKPLALDYDSAVTAEKLLYERKVSFYVNHTRRWNVNYLKARYIKENEKLGKLCQITGFINAGGQKFMGEGPILHDGTHLIDMVLFFCEDFPEDIFCDIEFENRIEKTANVYFRTDSGVQVYMNLGSDKRFFYYELELLFEFGKIIIGNQRFEIYKAEKSRNFTGFIELEKVNDISVFDFPDYRNRNFFELLYEEVVDDLDNNKVNTYSFHETLKVQKLIDRILNSKSFTG